MQDGLVVVGCGGEEEEVGDEVAAAGVERDVAGGVDEQRYVREEVGAEEVVEAFERADALACSRGGEVAGGGVFGDDGWGLEA